jgi:hypothetical protein
MKSHLALITILDDRGGPVDPGYGVGAPGGPVDPGWGVRPPVDPGYGQGHPSPPHPWFPVGGGLPPHIGGGPAHPPNYPTTGPVPTPPPVTPDNTLPEGGAPPQISLPIVLPPDPVVDDTRLFELKYSVRYGWVLVPVEDDAVAAPKK